MSEFWKYSWSIIWVPHENPFFQYILTKVFSFLALLQGANYTLNKWRANREYLLAVLDPEAVYFQSMHFSNQAVFHTYTCVVVVLAATSCLSH